MQMTQFQVGDVIYVELEVAPGIVVPHPGLFAGYSSFLSDDVVIHNAKGKSVIVETMSKFAQGRPVYFKQRAASPEAAQSAINNMLRMAGKPYDLLDFNCQQAVNLATTGRNYSETLAAFVGLGLCVVVGLAVVAASRR